VFASAAAVDRTDVKTATNYSLDSVDALPNTRTLEGVALLTPGVTSGVGGRVQIRGAMTSGNLYLLDGQNISDNAYNNRGVRLIDDSIEEVQVITGAISAEYGSVDGGVLNAITRSGGNEFAGQLRWELKDAAWNAYNPKEVRGSFPNTMNEEKTISLSGFIIKDKLWFSGSFFSTNQTNTGNITYDLGNRVGTGGTTGIPLSSNNDQTGLFGLNAPYVTRTKEIRRQMKLTYAVNQNHTVVASFNNSRIDDINRNYSAGMVPSLVPQVSTSEFLNFQWRAIWSNSITSELKFGNKKQKLSAGADAANGSPIYNYTTGGYFQNGIFNSNDGGDNRNNQTVDGKISMFWDKMGSHTTDMGFDYYKGTSKARNDQSATGFIFGVSRLSLNGTGANGAWEARPTDVWEYFSGDGEAHNFTTGIYVNDKWSVDKHLSFNLGLRYDKFSAENESGKSTAGASGISPRLGLKYDVTGDGKYLLGAAWARYNSKVLEGITNAVTHQGNATEIDHPYKLQPGEVAGTYHSFAYISDLAAVRSHYDFTKFSYYNDPTLNVALSNSLKAPQVDETQLSAQYFFTSPILGNGSVKLTGVNKKWKNLLDYTVGNSGHIAAPNGDDLYMRVWENSNIATREYKGLELEAQLQKDEWTLGGNATWSSLKGNYEGEATNSPAAGAGLKNFTVQDGVSMYDNSVTTPYGYLQGHVGLRIRATAARSYANAYGKTTIGLVYRLDTGAKYSKVRTISDITALNANISDQFGSSTTQYEGGRRMAGVLPTATYLDLAITHEFPLFKVAAKTVTGFFKANIGNFLNHQQQINFDTNYAPAASLSAAWLQATPATFGKPRNLATDYGTARTMAVSTGFRF
jgi:outer membrane receptor protein involved in Fe transport